jgi:hypothetical protein
MNSCTTTKTLTKLLSANRTNTRRNLVALEGHQLVPNAKLTVDGEPGVVLATDAQLVFLLRENGKVDLYDTNYVSENGEVVDSGNGGETPPTDGNGDEQAASSPSSTRRSRSSAA